MRIISYAVIAPKWRAWNRPEPSLSPRPLLKWRVVREGKPVMGDAGIVSSFAEHVSWHWTYEGAHRAALERSWPRRGGGAVRRP